MDQAQEYGFPFENVAQGVVHADGSFEKLIGCLVDRVAVGQYDVTLPEALSRASCNIDVVPDYTDVDSPPGFVSFSVRHLSPTVKRIFLFRQDLPTIHMIAADVAFNFVIDKFTLT